MLIWPVYLLNILKFKYNYVISAKKVIKIGYLYYFDYISRNIIINEIKKLINLIKGLYIII